MKMSPHQYEMVDLLEIYHARSLRHHLQRELSRLSSDEHCLPGHDPRRRAEILDFYHSMLITSAGLLHNLGDQPH